MKLTPNAIEYYKISVFISKESPNKKRQIVERKIEWFRENGIENVQFPAEK